MIVLRASDFTNDPCKNGATSLETLEFGQFLVGIAIVCPEPPEQFVGDGYTQLLIVAVDVQGIQGIIVGFGVYRSQDWWLVCRNPRQFSCPFSPILYGRLYVFFYLGKQAIVITLQRLMISGCPSEVEYKLGRSNHCDRKSSPHGINSEFGQQIAHGGSAKKDDCEIEQPVPQLKESSSSCVIKRVPQRVEAQIVRIADFQLSPFGGVLGLAFVLLGCRTPAARIPSANCAFPSAMCRPSDFLDGRLEVPGFFAIAYFLPGEFCCAGFTFEGWRGPWELSSRAGCLTPKLRCSITEDDGCRGPAENAPSTASRVVIFFISISLKTALGGRRHDPDRILSAITIVISWKYSVGVGHCYFEGRGLAP